MKSTVESYNLGKLSVLTLNGGEEFAKKVDYYLKKFNEDAELDTFLIESSAIRFGTGEAKATIKESVRSHDIYIIADVFNYGVSYKMYGQTVPMSPDDHFQDLKRLISAIGGKAKRLTVIMPMHSISSSMSVITTWMDTATDSPSILAER